MNWHLTLAVTCLAFAVAVFASTWIAGYRKGQRRNSFRRYGRVLPTPQRGTTVTRDSEWLVARPRGYFPGESTPFAQRDTTTGVGI